MGRDDDPMAVLTRTATVRRLIRGLRVVDAGVMPTITSGNTNSPVLMMAEKAAGLTGGRAGGLDRRRRGLILVPALFCHLPRGAPGRCSGPTRAPRSGDRHRHRAVASRRVQMRWTALVPATAAGVCWRLCRRLVVTVIDPGFLRKLLPLILLAVLLYHAGARKGTRLHRAPLRPGRTRTGTGGGDRCRDRFHDGFFRTGHRQRFLVILFVRLLGCDFSTRRRRPN